MEQIVQIIRDTVTKFIIYFLKLNTAGRLKGLPKIVLCTVRTNLGYEYCSGMKSRQIVITC